MDAAIAQFRRAVSLVPNRVSYHVHSLLYSLLGCKLVASKGCNVMS